MPHPASPLAPGQTGPRLTEPHLVTMTDEWALWRDMAVRTQRPPDAANWACELGLPRRVFLRAPGELKPIYIDFHSPVLVRIL
jgi:hypothetical protein